jgi:LysM repeat protein
MRLRIICPLSIAVVLAAPAAASADFAHTVLPGESLTSIAVADGLTVARLAAANDLSPTASLLIGSTLMIPPRRGPLRHSAALGAAGAARASAGSAGDDETTASGGSYVVAPGDTLSGIAVRAGTTVARLAAINGLDPAAPLLSGTALVLPGAGGAVEGDVGSGPADSQPVGATAEGDPTAPPYPTPERVSASEVGSIASANGVPAPLAQAVGWQESGFNNDVVSTADARGVMQILPGTWDWIQRTLNAGAPLAPASAADNVRGGVLLLRALLASTGNDPALAAAGYFQGLPSVRRHGMYRSTRRYVRTVLSLARQFGGG